VRKSFRNFLDEVKGKVLDVVSVDIDSLEVTISYNGNIEYIPVSFVRKPYKRELY
jgi:hypothetical protein